MTPQLRPHPVIRITEVTYIRFPAFPRPISPLRIQPPINLPLLSSHQVPHPLRSMSNPHLFTQDITTLDQRIMQMQDAIREAVLHLLRADQCPTPSWADLALGLQTLKSTADTTWILAEKQKLWAETERIKAYTEQLKAETEKIRVQKM